MTRGEWRAREGNSWEEQIEGRLSRLELWRARTEGALAMIAIMMSTGLVAAGVMATILVGRR